MGKNQTDRDTLLGTAPLNGLIAKFAIPSIISLLVNAAYNITDQIFIGNVVGMLGNAATNVAFPTVTITTALAQLVGIGTAANFNMNLGAKRRDEAQRYIGTGLTMMSIFGILLFAVIVLFKTPILLLCGATDSVLPLSQLYLGITAFGIPFLLFTNSASVLIRADGSPMYSMICTVIGAVLNVFLDWLFMFPLNWGIQGAALATITGQIVSFIFCILYFPRFKTFKIRFKSLGLRLHYVLNIVKLGTSNFINHVIMTAVNIVLNNTLTHYGALSIYGSDIPLAVAGIVAKLNTILVSFVVGLAQGCQPIWSFNMGAKNYDRVKKTFKKAVTAALIICVVAFLTFQLFPRQITGIFGSGDELYFEFAEKYLRIYLMMCCVFGVQPLSINYFTSIGQVRQGVVLSLSRQGFLLIPLLIILPLFLGLNGVLCAGPIADGLAALLSVILVMRSFKRLSAIELAETNQIS